jgi:hypothetical protein
MTRELKAIARKKALILVKEPIRLATRAESEVVRVAAIKRCSTEAFRKATQRVEGSLTYGISEQLAELVRGHAGNKLGTVVAQKLTLSRRGQRACCSPTSPRSRGNWCINAVKC